MARNKTLTTVDLFCGAGGFTTGAMMAARRHGVKLELTAINHDDIAIASHTLNHPQVRHLQKNLDSIDPRQICGPLRLLLASPECTNHSHAKGGMPREDQSRASGWHVVRWAEVGRPDRIIIENVEAYRRWGPLTKRGRPDKRKEGQTFRAFLLSLESLGYRVDHRVLNSADYGAATSRSRLFIQAWRGSQKPTWPEPTNSKENWTPASSIIDWSIQGKSIFTREKPLAPNTLRRIYAGLEKYSGIPFTTLVTHGADPRPRPVSEPLNTITTAKGGEIALVRPWLVRMRGTDDRQIEASGQSVDRPLPTITAGGGHVGVCQPFMVPFHKERDGQAPRTHDVAAPFPVVACSNTLALCQPFIIGQQSCSAPRDVSQPIPTVATAGAIRLAQPFLTKFYGTGGARPITDPLDTVTTKGRFGLCLPIIELEGEQYYLDILFRMLRPDELKRAMSFPGDYFLAGTQEDQIRQIGNAVDVRTAEAIIYNALEGVR